MFIPPPSLEPQLFRALPKHNEYLLRAICVRGHPQVAQDPQVHFHMGIVGLAALLVLGDLEPPEEWAKTLLSTNSSNSGPGKKLSGALLPPPTLLCDPK